MHLRKWLKNFKDFNFKFKMYNTTMLPNFSKDFIQKKIVRKTNK